MSRPLLDEVSLLDALEIETVGAITYELSGRFTDVNDTFLEMSGYSREDLEAGDLTWQRLTSAEWHHVSERARSQLEASGRTTPYEKQYFRKDGSRFWVLAASKLLPSGSAFGLVVDITDRKAAEARAAALARLSDRLSNLEGPDEIAFVAAQVLGEAVNATHVGYADMDEADMIRTQDDWIAPGIVPIIQSRRFHTPESVSGRLRQGEVIVIADVNADERSAHVGAVLENRHGRTIVLAPILEQGRLAAIFFVKDRQPRDWSAEEVALIQEVAHRTRTAVERARTTLALRETQEVLRRANEDLELRVAERTAERDRIWDISRDLMCVATMDGTFLNVNPAWERVLGWNPDQLLGRKPGEIRHPDDAASATVQLARNATGVPSHGFEARYRHREGGWRWISWSIQPEGDRLYGVGRDITAEKETRAALEAAEAARREADDLYRAYFQNSFEGLFVVAVRPDGEFSIEELNPAHNAAMGLPMKEIRGKVLAEQIGPEAAAAVSVNYRRAVDLEAPLRYRESGPVRGELRHYETVLVPVRDDTGRISRLVGSARDITAQVQLEAAEAGRRKADALYRGYFLNSAEGLFSIAVLPDGDFSVEEVNPAYEAVVGLDAQGKLGQPIEEQFGPEVAALVRSNYQRAVATGQVQRYRESAVLAGQLIQVETVLVPIRDESGQIARIVGSSRDMSVEAQLEASEAARRDADALYRAYFQNSTEALCIADVGADGAFSISDVNPAYEADSGLRASGKLGLPLDQQFPPALASSIAAKYRDVLTKGEVQQYQTSLEYEGKVSHAILVDVPLRARRG